MHWRAEDGLCIGVQILRRIEWDTPRVAKDRPATDHCELGKRARGTLQAMFFAQVVRGLFSTQKSIDVHKVTSPRDCRLWPADEVLSLNRTRMITGARLV